MADVSRDRTSAVRKHETGVAPVRAPRRAVPRVGVILAAGRSSRLHGVTGGGSKALVRLGGLTLIERAVRTLLTAGVDRVIVVVGYQAGTIAAVVGRFNPEQVSTVFADNWEDGNGASLAAVSKSVEGEDVFALMTTDHVFGDDALVSLLHTGEPAVLVDPGPDQAAWAEGTRVRIRGEVALRFGKKLTNPAIDCGAFVLPAEVFKCQRLAAAKGDHTLAGALTRLARIVPLRAVSIPARSWWFDVDTPEDLGRARVLLRRYLTKRTDGIVSRYLNRPISSRLSMFFAPLRVSPNLLSLIAFFAAIAGAWLYAGGGVLLAAILIQTGSILDGVDGEVARLTVKTSPRGALLDGVLDRIADAAIMAALGLAALQTADSPSVALLLTVAASTGALLSMASKDRIRAVGLEAPNPLPTDLISGRDMRLLVAAVCIFVGAPVVALGVIAGISFLALAARMIFVRDAR